MNARVKIDRTKRGWKRNCKVVQRGRWVCWEWLYATSNGRAMMYDQVKTKNAIPAAVFAYELFYGPIKNCCMHKCDNEICVRPGHLKDGTYSQNNFDLWNRSVSSAERRRNITLRWKSPDFKRRMAVAFKRRWGDPKNRAKVSADLRRLWRDPKYRTMMVKAQRARTDRKRS